MVKLAIDFEHPSRRWWENGGQSLWEGLLDDLGGSSVVLDDHVAESWLAEASRIPGWSDGPEYAPNPVRASRADEDDPDL
jgi:hypothetical protein